MNRNDSCFVSMFLMRMIMSEMFDFISEEDFREILQKDYDELLECMKNGCWKSVLVLSGSIIECVMLNELAARLDGKEREDIQSAPLGGLIERAKKLKLISEKVAGLSAAIKEYRNLIHAGKILRTTTHPSKNDAEIARSLLEMTLSDIASSKKKFLRYNG